VRRMAAVSAKQVLIAKVLREADSSHVQISAVEKRCCISPKDTFVVRQRHLLIYISIGIALVLFLVLTTFWRATH